MIGNNFANNQQRIFVSYADEDNIPFGSNKTRWVSNLLEEIKNNLKRARINVDIITEDHLSKRGLWKDRITEAVENSSILIPINSKAYLDSKKCVEVRDIFENKYRVDSESRIIVVEMDEIKDINPFEAYIPNKFWATDTKNQSTRTLCLNTTNQGETEVYYDRLIQLCSSISEMISDLTDQTKSIKLKTVFLAEPTENFEKIYSEVKIHLKNIGFSVLPKKSYRSSYEKNPKSVLEKLEKEIQRSNFFVQLIESDFCKPKEEDMDCVKPKEEDLGCVDNYLNWQYKLAKQNIKNRYLWIPQKFITDKERTQIESNHWILGENIQYNTIDEFKETLNEFLKPHIEKQENDDFLTASPDQQGGLMLVSGNIPKSEIYDKVKALMSGFKPVHKCFVEYMDSSHSNFVFYHQDCLSKKSTLQPFHLLHNKPIPLKFRKKT